MAEQPVMDSATETQIESVAPMPKSRNVRETAEHLNNLLNTEASKTQETASEELTEEVSTPETDIDETFEDDELIDQVEAEETTDSNEELYKLTVNGQEIEVTLDELRKGYSRQQDYTQKTEKLSQDRKSVEEFLVNNLKVIKVLEWGKVNSNSFTPSSFKSLGFRFLSFKVDKSILKSSCCLVVGLVALNS